MAKYHIGKNGPAVCKAHVKACPVGGEHFDNPKDAQAAFESTQTALPATSRRVKDNLAGKSVSTRNGSFTVDEYHDHLKKLHEEWGDKRPEVEANVREALGISKTWDENSSEWQSFSMTMNENEVNVEQPVPLSWGWGGEYDPDEDEAEFDAARLSAFYSNENFIDSSDNPSGYYGEDSYINYTFKTPEAHKEAINKVNEVDETRIDMQYLDRNYPKWAAYPEDTTLDGGPRFPKTHVTGTLYSTEGKQLLSKPTKSSALSGHKAIVNHVEKAKSLRKTEQVHKESIKTAQAYRDILTDEENYPTGTKIKDLNGFEFKLTKAGRRERIRNLDRKIHGIELNRDHAAKRAERLENVTPQDIQKSKRAIKEMTARYEANQKKWAIGVLSNRYPHSDENVRLAEAEKWLNSHPETFNHMLNN